MYLNRRVPRRRTEELPLIYWAKDCPGGAMESGADCSVGLCLQLVAQEQIAIIDSGQKAGLKRRIVFAVV